MDVILSLILFHLVGQAQCSQANPFAEYNRITRLAAEQNRRPYNLSISTTGIVRSGFTNNGSLKLFLKLSSNEEPEKRWDAQLIQGVPTKMGLTFLDYDQKNNAVHLIGPDGKVIAGESGKPHDFVVGGLQDFDITLNFSPEADASEMLNNSSVASNASESTEVKINSDQAKLYEDPSNDDPVVAAGMKKITDALGLSSDVLDNPKMRQLILKAVDQLPNDEVERFLESTPDSDKAETMTKHISANLVEELFKNSIKNPDLSFPGQQILLLERGL